MAGAQYSLLWTKGFIGERITPCLLNNSFYKKKTAKRSFKDNIVKLCNVADSDSSLKNVEQTFFSEFVWVGGRGGGIQGLALKIVYLTHFLILTEVGKSILQEF